jgi:CubicO group peptidase (beta-lactamase class C family)
VYRGKVIYERYAGLADLDAAIPIGPHTRFNIASNAKQFTALCVLDLVRRGRLGLTDDIRTYFPALLTDSDPPITVMELLTHTSGIRDVYDLWSLQGYTWWEETFTNTDALNLLGKQLDLNFPSGSAYAYSNSNYILLAGLVEKVSGQSFGAFSRELFLRWGMEETAYSGLRPDSIPNLARPYFNFDTWLTYDWITRLEGDGALFTTLADQLTFELLAQRPYLAPAADVSTIAHAQTLPRGFAGSYGFGLEHGSYRGRPYRYHHGSTGAWKATVFRFEREELSIVVVNNSGKFSPAQLTAAVADAVLDYFDPVPAAKATVARTPEALLAGLYRNGGDLPLRYELRSDTLFVTSPFADTRPLVYTEENCYEGATDSRYRHCFSEDKEAKRAVTVSEPNRGQRRLLLSDREATIPAGTDWSGSYYNSELDLTLDITAGSDGEYTLELGDESKIGVPFGGSLLVGPDLVISIDPRAQPTELLIDIGRLRKLRFR